MKIVTFFKLNPDEKILLFRTLFLMWKIRIMLWILPFPYIKNSLFKSNEIKNIKSKYNISNLIWAVETSSKFVLKATCLVNALTAYLIFSSQNYPSQVKIGVGKGENDTFEAHAWLEINEEIIIGKCERNYSTILSIS